MGPLVTNVRPSRIASHQDSVVNPPSTFTKTRLPAGGLLNRPEPTKFMNVSVPAVAGTRNPQLSSLYQSSDVSRSTLG